MNSQKEESQIYGETVASGIKLSLNQSIYASVILKDLYAEYDDIFLQDFERICARISSQNSSIGSLYFAPKAVIEYAYPPDVSGSTIGFRMLEDKKQRDKALLAIDKRSTTVAGPHKLVEGGTGFIIRNPIFHGDEFIGFTIVVIDWEIFKEKLITQLKQSSDVYKFGVWKTDDQDAVTDEFGYILKNCEGDIERKLDIAIDIPNDTWHLTVEPAAGWWNPKDMIIEIIVVWIFVIGIFTLILIRMIRGSEKLYTAEHDELTDLYTKQAFMIKAEQILKNNPHVSFDVMISDIENFKLINLLYGQEKGDEVLLYFASRFQARNKNALFGRFGGDSFVCMFRSSENEGADTFQFFIKKVIDEAPVKNLKINFGIYTHVEKRLSMTQICERAFIAARSIKQNFEESIANYNGPISSKHLKEQLLETSFETALKNNEFKVFYQPKYDAHTEILIGAEALVRWIKDDGVIISPVEFIELFETDGLIIRLDEFVFNTVCNSINSWKKAGLKTVPVSVNLSRTCLLHEGMIDRYKTILRNTELTADLVPLELTESASSGKREIKEMSSVLKNEGFHIHMDDFGTGFSSLENLNVLPFDAVKLDKSLIDFIGDPGGNEILKHTIELAHFKNMYIVAEGVENRMQLEFLKQLECDAIQGYLFSRPVPEADFVELLKGI